MATLYRKRADTLMAMQCTPATAAEVAAFIGGYVGADGLVSFDVYPGFTITIPWGAYTWPELQGWVDQQSFEAQFSAADGPGIALAIGSTGVAGTIAPSATRDLVVTLSQPMPTALYKASAAITAGSVTLLGAIQIVDIVAQTKTDVTVRVKNAGLTSLSSPAITVTVFAAASVL